MKKCGVGVDVNASSTVGVQKLTGSTQLMWKLLKKEWAYPGAMDTPRNFRLKPAA